MQRRETTQETNRAAAQREIQKVLPLIDRIKREQQGRNWTGTETCPICQRQIRIHHFREEGKTWGRCATKNCVAWMVSLVLALMEASVWVACAP